MLGGHSLLATQMVSRLKKRLFGGQIALALRTLFEHSTLLALAEYIETSLIATKMRERATTIEDVDEVEEW